MADFGDIDGLKDQEKKKYGKKKLQNQYKWPGYLHGRNCTSVRAMQP
jgi:K+-transporting ATPase c subunit